MNKDEKLKELEERQRALAEEIRALREHKEEEFVRGRFYKSKSTGVIVVCDGQKAAGDDCFSAIGASPYYNPDPSDNCWSRKLFTEVIPKWLTPWELKNPEGIDFSKPEHDTDEIPDWWLCEVWDSSCKYERRLRFFDGIAKATISTTGERDGAHWDHYRMIPAEEWSEWAREAWRNRGEK